MYSSEWKCSTCSMENNYNRSVCQSCNAQRPIDIDGDNFMTGRDAKMPDFGRLVRDSKVLTAHIDTQGVPNIRRTLAQLEATSRNLARKHPKGLDPSLDANCQMFFAQKGLDIAKHARTVRRIDLASTYHPLEQLSDLDMDKFLEHQHQMLVNTTIAESTEMTARTLRSQYISLMEADWVEAKRDILEGMGFRKDVSNKSHVPAWSKGQLTEYNDYDNVHGRLSTAGAKSQLSYEQEQYAHVVLQLNHHRRASQPYGLIKTFEDTAESVEKHYTHHGEYPDVRNAWLCLRYIIGERDVLNGQFQNQKLEEMQYRDEYARNSSGLMAQMMSGAKRYCEETFVEHVRGTLRRNRANTGVDVVKLIREYVKGLTTQWDLNYQPEMLNGCPFWPQVFFCLRAGHPRAALSLISQAIEAGDDLKVLESCLRHRTQGEPLSEQESKALNDEYNLYVGMHQDRQHRRHGHAAPMADPYKITIYQLIGFFASPRDINIDWYQYTAPYIEDYLWLKLSLVWTSDVDPPAHVSSQYADPSELSLKHLQEKILGRTDTRFHGDGRNPLKYFKKLLLSLQFEQAIAYLARTDLFEVATHMAIALNYYGLLRITDVNDDLLCGYQQDMDGRVVFSQLDHDYGPGANMLFAVNFMRILNKYIEPFVRTNPIEAFHYLYLLYINRESGADLYDALCEIAISDLVIETREFNLLIGADRRGLIVKGGCIYKYFPEEKAKAIIAGTAKIASDYGNDLEAVHLYTLAELDDRVIDLLLKLLCRVVSADYNNDERVEIVELTKKFLSRMENKLMDNYGGSTAVFGRSSFSSSTAGALTNTPGASSSSSSSHLRTPHLLDNASSSLMMDSRGDGLDMLANDTIDPSDQASLENNRQSLIILLDLVDFFDCYHAGPDHYDQSLNIVEGLGIIPWLNDEQERVDVEESSRRFDQLHFAIKRNFADVVMACMLMYYDKFQQVKKDLGRASRHFATSSQGNFGAAAPRDISRQKILTEYRRKARALVNFIAATKMTVAADINARLVRLEALMA